ncbi:MAG: polysaccharide biosynthesis C-terminal domain-containing protein, partial [Clostridia bacterium]|nr:polysaccharide biosynthesis C-terminal domain-containing protein [Clostridia bacterium]
TAVMAAAGNLSTTLACLTAVIYLGIYYSTRRKDIKSLCKDQTAPSENIPYKKLVFVILAVSIPFSISSLISTANSAIDTVTVSRCIQNVFAPFISDKTELERTAMELYGKLQKAETITHLPMAVSSTLYAAMVPVVSAAFAKGDYDAANKKIASSVFLSSLVICPCMGGLVILADPILRMLYPSVPDGALILQLLVITLPLCTLTYILNGVLYGAGKLKIPAIALGIGAVVKLVLNIALISIPSLNIYGAVISTITYQTVVFIIETVVVYKTITIKIDFKQAFLKPALSALVMSGAVWGAYTLLSKFTGNTVSTVLSVFVGVIVYAAALFVFKTFKKEDVLEFPKGEKIAKLLGKVGLIR